LPNVNAFAKKILFFPKYFIYFSKSVKFIIFAGAEGNDRIQHLIANIN